MERSSGAAPSRLRLAEADGASSASGQRLGVAIGPAGDDVCVVTLTGELDLSTVALVETRLFEHLDSHAGVVIDLSRLAFIDSSGIGLLIKAHRAEGAPVHTVVAPDSQVHRVFRLACIDRALPTFSDLDQALAALGVEAPSEGIA